MMVWLSEGMAGRAAASDWDLHLRVSVGLANLGLGEFVLQVADKEVAVMVPFASLQLLHKGDLAGAISHLAKPVCPSMG